jgi:NADP-dependent 3-hydroxy acid dehydrogenase YdfG
MQNKIIIITGSSQGLGKETALKLAKLGANLCLIARSEDLLQEVVAEIKIKGGKADYLVCDIREMEQIKKTVEKIKDKYKQIDVLINNAGVWTDENLEKKNYKLRENAFKTNALGTINFTYEMLPIFKKQNKGHILNVISTAGETSNLPSADNRLWKSYGATKWALTGFSKDLRNDLEGTKIKLTQFYPGGFDSNLYENAKRENPHNQPWMIKTKDVADMLIFTLTRPDDLYVEKIVFSKMM